MNRATAATLAVSFCLSGPGPLLAQGAEPDAPPRVERILELLNQPEGSVVLSTSSPRGSTVALAGFSRLQRGVPHPQADPPRRGGDATMIAFYSLFFGGIAMTIDGFADDPNGKRKILGGLALIGGAFAVSCTTGAC